VRLLPVVDDLRLELERHILERQPSPDEYLLYPEKLGPEFYRGPVGVIWGIEDERTSATAMHRSWTRRWRRCWPAMPTLARPRNIYTHLDTSDLESALAGGAARENSPTGNPHLLGVEAAGIEPASADAPERASTSLSCR
jgi:hypothetical protein